MHRRYVLATLLTSLLTNFAVAQKARFPAAREEQSHWLEAMKKFEAFAAPRIKEAKDKFPDQPMVRFVEYRSQTVLEAFPEHRLFALDAASDGSSCLFALHCSGKIEDLGNCTWTGDVPSKSFQVRAVLDFVRAANIKVKNAEAAIAAAQLVEEVQGAPNYAIFLRINTKDFTVFDRRFIERFYGPRNTDWKWSAEKREGGGWLVTREYVGPPASVQQPPVYEMDLSDKQELLDLRWRNLLSD
jgi:hypothetical protein